MGLCTFIVMAVNLLSADSAEVADLTIYNRGPCNYADACIRVPLLLRRDELRLGRVTSVP